MTELSNILFLDIETVSNYADYDNLDERLKTQWVRKAAFLKRHNPESTEESLYFEKAGIFAEFGRIIVVSLGYFHQEGDQLTFRVTSIHDHDEVALLQKFCGILNRMSSEIKLCAHNGKEFDFPYLSRRLLINGLALPAVLNLSGKKPWEVNHIDTMDMWKFGDWKHFTSLELMAALFGIESSKSTIDGSKVNEYYHHREELQTIADYCREDVIVTAQLYCKLKSLDPGKFEVMIIPQP